MLRTSRRRDASVAATPLLTTALGDKDWAVRVQAAPPEHRVYMVTDSVGLGAKNALPAAFPPDWQVTVDGTPALFVEQLDTLEGREEASAPKAARVRVQANCAA